MTDKIYYRLMWTLFLPLTLIGIVFMGIAGVFERISEWIWNS